MNGLLSVAEAQARLLGLHAPLSSETVNIAEAAGRYISRDILADRDQPAADLSAMDGYAIRYDDLPGPWVITGEIAAGSAPARSLAAGEAIRIFTGALVPSGADTVVVQEDVVAFGDQLKLTGDGPGARGRHIRVRAGDFARGETLLASGTRMTAGAIAAAIMGGGSELVVRSRPRVAILTTGDELVAPGVPLAQCQIPNSNGAMLAAMLASEAARVGQTLHVGDDRAMISRSVSDLARRHDVIVTVGGASVGDHDHVRDALDDAGGRLDFWKVAIRPGKPLIAGMIGNTLLLGLPGNPASAFVTATLFLVPLVRHLAGALDPYPRILSAPLAAPLAPGGTRCDYMRARLDEGRLTVFPLQDSGQTVPLSSADALVIRNVDARARQAGDMADYIAIA